jgi:hypothetical protein
MRIVSMKRCRDCGLDKSLEEFPAVEKRSDGRGSYCRPCMLERSRVNYRKRVEAAGGTVREKRTDGLKQCPDCEQVLALDQFPRNRNGADGRHSYCKPCHTARGVETYTRLYGGTRAYHLQRRYGISESDFDAMLEAQGGLCAVCGEQPAVHVDHDHVFGNVRGLTCFNCNGGLGQFKDRVDIMLKAIDYLERTQWQRTLVSTGVYRLTSPRQGAAASGTSSELQRLISSRRG